VVKLWKESLGKVNQKAADALANPTDYSNLFPGLQEAFLAEDYLKETHVRLRPAAEYPLITVSRYTHILGTLWQNFCSRFGSFSSVSYLFNTTLIEHVLSILH
jgi:hypothetical protein